MKISENHLVGEIVAGDYRAAAVFSRYGIDFCCKGNISISEVCNKKNIDAEGLIRELELALMFGPDTGKIDFQSWPVDLLADYIEKKHHRYVEEKTPILIQYLTKLRAVHGGNHPELHEIAEHFIESSKMLAAHMKKEELVLFPFIRKMATSKSGDLPVPQFGSVNNPIAMMKHEHDVEGERFREIARLSENYNAPSDACSTYRVTFAMLKEFEADLHLHIHLENNILFPRVIEMEAGSARVNSCQVN